MDESRANGFQSAGDLLCAWVRRAGELIKLMFINSHCQFINQSCGNREQGLEDIGQKTEKRLMGARG